MKFFLVVFSIIQLLFVQSVFSASLCEKSEKVVFTCEIKKKKLSVCQPKDGLVIYRYGTLQKKELTLRSKPYFSSTMHPGGGGAHIRFQNNQYSYIVYSFIRGINEKIEGAGVYVLKNDKLLVDLECTGFEDDIYGIRTVEGYIEEEFKEEGIDF